MIDIYSIHYNKPEYLSIQLNSFKKYISEPFEFTVIDNSIDELHSQKIHDICIDNNLKYHKTFNTTPHSFAHYGWSHIYGLNCFKNFLINSKYQIVALIEHDVFLCSSIDNIKYLIDSNSICGYTQPRENIIYLHPGILFFNKNKCHELEELDFLGGRINGIPVDVGGQTYHYINKKNISVNYIDEYIVHGLNEIQDKHIFYHMIDGSNWSGTASIDNELKIKYIKEKLKL